MYQQFYNLSAEPFRLSPDHAFAYSHRGYSKARAYMAYAFMRAEGFVMITGRPGTGKTTLVGALLDELARENVSVANLVCTQVKADDLLKLVAYDFGIAPTVVEKAELLQALTQQFKAWHRDGRRALLIVDEAQDLSISAMEELRLLTNIQLDGRPLLQIFLLGQPELRELILSPQLEQVHQRIIAASHLQPLECEETEAYIRHRLLAVNWRGDPDINSAVYPLIFKFSDGVPRRINLICSRLLLHCAVEQRHQVELADLRVVVQELQEEKLAAGVTFAERDFQPAAATAQQDPGQSIAHPVNQSVVDNERGTGAKPLLQGAVPVPAAVTNPGIRRVAPQGAAVAPGANPVTARNLVGNPAGNLAANLVEKPNTLALIKKPVVLTGRVPLRTPVAAKPGLKTPPSGALVDSKKPLATTRPPATARPARMQPAVDSAVKPNPSLKPNPQPKLRTSDMRLSAKADQRLGDSSVSPQAASPGLWALAVIVLLAAAGGAWAMLGSNGGAGW